LEENRSEEANKKAKTATGEELFCLMYHIIRADLFRQRLFERPIKNPGQRTILANIRDS